MTWSTHRNSAEATAVLLLHNGSAFVGLCVHITYYPNDDDYASSPVSSRLYRLTS